MCLYVITSQSGSTDMSCRVDHHVSGCEYFGRGFYVLLSQQNVISMIALQALEIKAHESWQVRSLDQNAGRGVQRRMFLRAISKYSGLIAVLQAVHRL